ncbi:MAG: ABC transporter permease [Thiotrichales bacterium]|nr:ABC transporter permease [Thiotrichales bacterium]
MQVLRRNWVLIAPIAFLILFVILPFGFVLTYSVWTLHPVTGLMQPALSLENYARFFQSTLYVRVLWNTFEIAGTATVFALLICYPFAWWLGRVVPVRWQTALLMAVIILFWTSFLIRTYAWIGILQERGLLDLTVMALGVSDEPLGMLFTRTAVIIGFVHVFLPLMLMPIYASVRNLDGNLLLAAQDLGATPVRTFLRVTLPLTMTGVLTGILLFFTPTFGAFVTPLLLGSTESIMIGNVVETQFGEAFNWPYGSALSCIVVVTVVALLVLFNRYVAFDDLYRNR